MSGPSRYIPSRRSRFRMPDPDRPHRPAEAPVPETPASEVFAGVPEDAANALTENAPLPTELGTEVPPLDTAAAAPGYGEDAPWPTDDAHPLPPVEEGVVTREDGAAPVPQTAPDSSELPQAFKLRNVYEGRAPMRRGLFIIYVTLVAIVLTALGALGGYVLGLSHAGQRAPGARLPDPLSANGSAALTLSAETQAQIDNAFDATKGHRYADAQIQFKALYAAHPEWPSMAIEDARAALYQLDAPATIQALNGLTRHTPSPDAAFLMALLHLTHKEFEDADFSFATAVALDPARPDFYYFWGDCLRDQGKPRDAAQKFQEALLRNQYETVEDLYQLKFWLSLIQADEEKSSGLDARIDEGLKVTPRPAYSVVFAAAAREIKHGRFKEAAAFLAQGRLLAEPVVFQVILQDPTFVQESWRPEFAGFYATP